MGWVPAREWPLPFCWYSVGPYHSYHGHYLLLARTHLKEVGEGGASRCFRKRWHKRRSSDLDLQEFEKGVRGVFREGVRGS